MPPVLPQSYGTCSLIRIPKEPKTIGDHIRRKRLQLKMFQKDVADQLGVHKTSVFNWEANTSQPDLRYVPAVLRFLGYNPLPDATSWGERLVRHRTSLGLTQTAAAAQIEVDQGTLARWERGERQPIGAFLSRVERFLRGEEAKLSAKRRTG